MSSNTTEYIPSLLSALLDADSFAIMVGIEILILVLWRFFLGFFAALIILNSLVGCSSDRRSILP
jgi:hypothetical protein